PARQKELIKEQLNTAEYTCCVVGTHALLQEDVTAQGVGLTIIDEQHRFGVAQRKTLQGMQRGVTPHLLSMTATPIPRTLNLTVYGDLDVSVLREMPAGRKPIVTKVILPDEHDESIIHVLQELHHGRQAYVIAPLVEESEKLEAKSATEAYEEMRHLFPGIAVGLVHGKMKPEEKEAAIRNFNAGALQLLVSTAVVEVGVNVPNATCMIIEGAERFGLAQLHQFRGRVGRGEQQSYCYLFPTTRAAASSRRLHIMEQTTDGFVIAEEDLKLRGPGEVYGLSQSGFGDLQVASLLDYDTIKKARTEAEHLLRKDPELKNHPILQKKVEQKNLQTHFE
ncbi:MAG: helicase-related protein, partial [Acidobacteriota bacterium]